jgi:hypothetical protein
MSNIAIAEAQEIKRLKKLHAAFVKHSKDAIDRALELGEILTRIKESMGHGEWLLWLEANVPEISTRTAQNCMRLWKKRDLLKNAADAYLVESVSDALVIVYGREKEDAEAPETAAPDTAESAEGGAAPGLDERARKRKIMQHLGREFVRGLEMEELPVLELILRTLPEWRLKMLTGARQELSPDPTTSAVVVPFELAA